MIDFTSRTTLARALACCALAVLFAACGGGGGGSSSGCTNIDPTRSSSLPGCGGTGGSGSTGGTGGSTDSTAPTLGLALLDAGGAPVNTSTPDRPGVIVATFKDSKGIPLENATVTVTSNDLKASYSPVAGSALTDSKGVAKIGVLAASQSGAYVASVVAVKGSLSAKSTINYAIQFPTLSMSAMRIDPNPVSVGGTATVAVTVLSGGQNFTTPVTVNFTSTCVPLGRAGLGPLQATPAPVLTVGGVATISYVDLKCGAADPIVATLSYGGVTITQTGTVTTLGTTAGQIAFVSALPQNIALKGTGGPGRQESSVVTFKVMDKTGKAVPGANVAFAISGASGTSGTGATTLSPASAISTADGTVVTSVLAGTVNTPVRVVASLVGTNPLVTTVSDQLVVSTGIPDQNSFSISASIYNVEGGNFDGCPAKVGSVITVHLADHFNNPVPDGTAVSFTSEGGQVGASCLTGLVDTQLTSGSPILQSGRPGECSVKFCSAAPRVADERVTILAYALGEESFVDNPALPNSINRYDPGETFEDLCEPTRNDAAIVDTEANSTVKDSKISPCPAPKTGEVYIDTNGDGLYTATGDGIYNGVLNIDPATGQTAANSLKSSVHVRGSLVLVMSGSNARIDAVAGLTAGTITLPHCVDGTPFVNTPAVTAQFAIRDTNGTIFPGNPLSGNILPAGTKIELSASNGNIVSNTSYTVPNTNDPSYLAWLYNVQMVSDATQTGASATPPYACTNTTTSGTLKIKVTTPQGIETGASYDVKD
jgi:hypothetical protein